MSNQLKEYIRRRRRQEGSSPWLRCAFSSYILKLHNNPLYTQTIYGTEIRIHSYSIRFLDYSHCRLARRPGKNFLLGFWFSTLCINCIIKKIMYRFLSVFCHADPGHFWQDCSWNNGWTSSPLPHAPLLWSSYIAAQLEQNDKSGIGVPKVELATTTKIRGRVEAKIFGALHDTKLDILIAVSWLLVQWVQNWLFWV